MIIHFTHNIFSLILYKHFRCNLTSGNRLLTGTYKSHGFVNREYTEDYIQSVMKHKASQDSWNLLTLVGTVEKGLKEIGGSDEDLENWIQVFQVENSWCVFQEGCTWDLGCEQPCTRGMQEYFQDSTWLGKNPLESLNSESSHSSH